MKKILLIASAAIIATGVSAETRNVLAEMYPGSASLIGWGLESSREVVTEDGRESLKVTNPSAGQSWEAQIAYDAEFTEGTTYYFTFEVKGDAGTITSGFQQTNGYAGCGNFSNFEIKPDWNTVTIKGTAGTSDNGDPNRWVAIIGDYVGTFYISNMSLYTLEEGGETPEDPGQGWSSIINGGNATDGETSSIQAGWSGPAKVVANPAGAGNVFEAPIAADPANAWDSQLFIVFNEALETGAKYKVSFDYYCTDSRSIDVQAQGDMGAYHHWTCGFSALDAKPEWQSVSLPEYEVTAEMAGSDGFKTMAFNLSSAPAAATFYINNVIVEKEAATAVEAVSSVKATMAGVYNLNGVKVLDNAQDLTALPKGIYIVNGKKVVR